MRSSSCLAHIKSKEWSRVHGIIHYIHGKGIYITGVKTHLYLDTLIQRTLHSKPTIFFLSLLHCHLVTNKRPLISLQLMLFCLFIVAFFSLPTMPYFTCSSGYSQKHKTQCLIACMTAPHWNTWEFSVCFFHCIYRHIRFYISTV